MEIFKADGFVIEKNENGEYGILGLDGMVRRSSDKTYLHRIEIKDLVNKGHTFTMPSVLFIPGQIGEYKITYIARDAFENSFFTDTLIKPVFIRELYIGEGIERIEYGAFYMHFTLEKVRLPSTLKSIGALAFCDCQHVKHFDIPAGLEKIDPEAFCDLTRSKIYAMDLDGAYKPYRELEMKTEVCDVLDTLVFHDEDPEEEPYYFHNVTAVGDRWEVSYSHGDSMKALYMVPEIAYCPRYPEPEDDHKEKIDIDDLSYFSDFIDKPLDEEDFAKLLMLVRSVPDDQIPLQYRMTGNIRLNVLQQQVFDTVIDAAKGRIFFRKAFEGENRSIPEMIDLFANAYVTYYNRKKNFIFHGAPEYLKRGLSLLMREADGPVEPAWLFGQIAHLSWTALGECMIAHRAGAEWMPFFDNDGDPECCIECKKEGQLWRPMVVVCYQLNNGYCESVMYMYDIFLKRINHVEVGMIFG